MKKIVGPLVAILLATFGLCYHPHRGELEMKSLLTKSIEISSGEDGIWSYKEKAQFFKDNGITGGVVSEGGFIGFDYSKNNIKVYSAYAKVEFGLSRPDLRKSNSIGRISRESLERYVENN